MNSQDLCNCLQVVKEEVNSAREWLIELDSAIGDGDLGITMSRGFLAIADECAKNQESDIGKLMMKLGMVFNRVSPSTMGTLMSTALLRSGKELSDKQEIVEEDIVRALEAAVQGIKDRGKAKPGDKTIIDVLEPSIAELKSELNNKQGFTEAWSAAAVVAKESFDKTTEMESQVGRASWFKEKSIGNPDPGAGLALIIWQAIEKYLRGDSR